ncbi:MAG TPA: Xaa-Pro peptidase family protein [Acidimicrobiia bacterium]|nr:Xaa-Pro peptidase family protein [Acidimicrobiia bacterium]
MTAAHGEGVGSTTPRPTTGAFPADEYTARMEQVRTLMGSGEHDLDALVVASPENIYYLIGLNHQGYFAFTMLVVPRQGEPILLTRRMEAYTISQQAPDVNHIGYGDDEDAGTAAVQALRNMGFTGGRVGVDRSSMFLPAGVWEEMERGLPDVQWVDTSRSPSTADRFRAGLVDEVRLVKSEREIAYIRKAASISDRSVAAALSTAGVGVNEMEVAAAAYREMILGGGEYPGFVPLIRSSETLHQEHSTWRDRHLMPGEALFVELSGASARYHAPLTRMAYLARAEPGAGRARQLALAAFDAVVSKLRPGVVTGEVYDAWQEVVDDRLGHDRLQRHHCGYSVGIGFPPSWVGSSTVLGIRRGGRVEIAAGMTFHVLSWITDPALGDYFTSDTVIVGQDGAEVVTTTPRDLVIA